MSAESCLKRLERSLRWRLKQSSSASYSFNFYSVGIGLWALSVSYDPIIQVGHLCFLRYNCLRKVYLVYSLWTHDTVGSHSEGSETKRHSHVGYFHDRLILDGRRQKSATTAVNPSFLQKDFQIMDASGGREEGDVCKALLSQEVSYSVVGNRIFADSGFEEGSIPLQTNQQSLMRRRHVVEWFYSVVDFFQLERTVVAIAMNFLDRAAGATASGTDRYQLPCTGKDRYQLLATACLYLAVKLHGDSCPSESIALPACDSIPYRQRIALKTYVDLSRGQFTEKDIEKTEEWLLHSALSWRVNPPTIRQWLYHLLQNLYSTLSIGSSCSDLPHDDSCAILLRQRATLSCVFDRACYLSELLIFLPQLLFAAPTSQLAYACAWCALREENLSIQEVLCFETETIKLLQTDGELTALKEVCLSVQQTIGSSITGDNESTVIVKGKQAATTLDIASTADASCNTETDISTCDADCTDAKHEFDSRYKLAATPTPDCNASFTTSDRSNSDSEISPSNVMTLGNN